MCGIAGSVWTRPELAISQDVLGKMMTSLRHRGPDDHGTYLQDVQLEPASGSEPGVALGFRRLAIIDLQTGNQPLANEDGSIQVIFNGEIYNFQELRNRLKRLGHEFRTESDTETIVHLYEEEGTSCFQQLNGMFSLAIWDQRQRKLILARDRFGQKPLFYRQQNGRLTFASELKGILEVPGTPRTINPHAIDLYLTYQYIPHPHSIFEGISKLPPGHYAVYEDDQLQVQPYWQLPGQREASWDPEEAQQRTVDLLRDSVRMRMQSDVPLGAFLSGGVDSSLIVALMQQESSNPVKTFSIGFPVREYDETNYARQVAEHLGTDHHEFRVEPDAVDILPQLVWHYDEPFADSSAIPTWYVAQQTRQHVTVALSGDGGDELFAGYPRYQAVRLAGWFDRMQPVKHLAAAKFWQRLPGSNRYKSYARRWKRFAKPLHESPINRYLEWISIFGDSQRLELYNDNFYQQLRDADSGWFLQSVWQQYERRDAITAISLTDLSTYLPCDLMTKVDIATMAHSLECRQPFLDYRLVEFAASLPIKMKLGLKTSKLLLQKAFADQLPNQIWKRKKMGFGVPLDQWFRNELKPLTHDVLLDPQARCHEFFQPETIQQLVQQHESGQQDHSQRLWAVLFLEMWMREWLPSAA
ncbi:MAG: asparagine synthase (glutamine-hydrolyzing) [Pirellulaceae bacterium]